MESLLSPLRDGQKPRTFRNILSGVAVSAALLTWGYAWVAFPPANVRKDLQLVGLGLLLASFLARLGGHKTAK